MSVGDPLGRPVWIPAELQQADLITSEERRRLSYISDVARVRRGQSPEVMSKTPDVLQTHGLEEESKVLAVLTELQQVDLITSKECKCLSDISDVVKAQWDKSPEVKAISADVLKRQGFEKESRLLAVNAVLVELQLADLITGKECKELSYISDVVNVQSGKSSEVMAKTAAVLRRHGFEEESRLLAVLAELQQADLITSEECEELTDICDVVEAQWDKPPEVNVKSADVLRRHGFWEKSRLLQVFAELQQADLITSEECKRLQSMQYFLWQYDLSGVVKFQRGKSPEVKATTAAVLRRHGFEEESRLLAVNAVIVELRQADLITAEEHKELSYISDVARVQSGKPPEVMAKTAAVLRRHGFEKESRLLAVNVVFAELQQADLISSEECDRLQLVLYWCQDNINNVIRDCVKSSEMVAKAADVLRRHGFQEESRFLAVLAELRQSDLITSKEYKKLSDLSDVVEAQWGKSPEMKVKSAAVLRRHEFEKESQVLAVLAELQQADLVTSEECDRLQLVQYSWRYDLSDVVSVQGGKSPEAMSKTADILRRHGFEKESKVLAVNAVLVELHRADLITSEECQRLNNISKMIGALCAKSPEVVIKTGDVLRRHGFEEESRFLAVLVELQQTDLITSEECRGLNDISVVVSVQRVKSPEVMSKAADVLRRHGFKEESPLLAVLAELRQADLITSEDCRRLSDISDVVRVQRGKSPEVVVRTADVLRRHEFVTVSKRLTDSLPHYAAKAELQHLVDKEWSRLSSDYHRLKKSVGAVVKHLPKRSRHLFRCEYKAVSLSAKRMCRRPRVSKVLDARELRKQIHALHDPELLQQLSSYEEDSLKPFIVTFLERCRKNGVQPDSSQPAVLLSPSTPAGQVLRFILSRKDYYVTDLHIDREHFSPWDVDTPPLAQVPPILDGPDHRHRLDTLLTSYAALFTKVVENVETLPRHPYLNLKSSFQYQPHTKMHLPSSQRDVRDCLHHTPMFAPLCTALLRKVVWFLFTHDTDNLSRQLEDYEKKLATFVSQLLLACGRDCVVPPKGDVSFNEDGCDPSDHVRLLACVLALKPYYVGSLCVDESLFTTLQRKGSLEEEGEWEENVSMDASPLEPTPPTSESENMDSSVPPQCKGKGKHRMSTSPSAVPAKRSAQGEDREKEEEEKEEEERDSARSSAKRRRREEGASQSGTGTVTDNGGNDVIMSQKVYDHPRHLILFRNNVSRTAAGKGRAVLEGVGLKAATITACFKAHPMDEEEGIQAGLMEWSGSQGLQPPTWKVLLEAMSYAKVEQQYIQCLKTDLGLP